MFSRFFKLFKCLFSLFYYVISVSMVRYQQVINKYFHYELVLFLSVKPLSSHHVLVNPATDLFNNKCTIFPLSSCKLSFLYGPPYTSLIKYAALCGNQGKQLQLSETQSRMYEHMNKSASTWASFNNSNKSNLSYRTHQVETSWSLLLALELFNHHTRFEKPAVPIRGRH